VVWQHNALCAVWFSRHPRRPMPHKPANR